MRPFWKAFDRRSLLVLLAILTSAAWNPAYATATDVVTTFRETDETFANPGQGWMTMRRLPDVPGRFPYSVAYFRLNWEELEPVEGQYNWRLIDEAIAAWAKREARIAFRIMTTNAHSKGYYCSPKWLFDAGCKSFEYVAGGADIASGGARITRIEPDYGDRLYLEKHGQFIKALAERYDGNPQIEFLDIGSYGIWGEWHTKHPQADHRHVPERLPQDETGFDVGRR
jgi:hypothetical protein